MMPLYEAVLNGLEAADVERRARRRLAEAGYDALRQVCCQFQRGALLLSGDVPSYYHKQLAQEVVRSLPEVGAVVNQITVISHRRARRAQERS